MYVFGFLLGVECRHKQGELICLEQNKTQQW